MAYDYAGPWSTTVSHQAALYSPSNSPSTPSTNKAINYYLSKGIDSKKLVMGIPLYGRSFLSSNGIGLGGNFDGTGKGSWEKGVWDYKVLSTEGGGEGIQVINDSELGASYSQTSNEFISFDTPSILKVKLDYIKQNQLGGVMFWELSGDKPSEGGESLVKVAKDGLGMLDRRLNCLSYEGSKFGNVRSGME